MEKNLVFAGKVLAVVILSEAVGLTPAIRAQVAKLFNRPAA